MHADPPSIPAHFDPPVGLAEDLGQGVRRILAPNPSPMTFRGTNTYLVGRGELAVIDPGPADTGHLQAILDALQPGEQISHILVTHAHLDHSPLARRLAQHTGAPVLAYGDAMAGRSAVMQDLADAGLAGGGEGVDRGFIPDRTLADGEVIRGADWSLTALWTPGHFGNHLCFQMDDVIFTGDLVMGWASSLVSPPDGDLTDFMRSCARLAELPATRFHSGHGAPVEDPQDRLRWLLDHRRSREAQILKALEAEGGSPEALARRIYTEIPEALLPAASRNVFAHLVDLHGRNKVEARPNLRKDAEFFRI